MTAEGAPSAKAEPRLVATSPRLSTSTDCTPRETLARLYPPQRPDRHPGDQSATARTPQSNRPPARVASAMHPPKHPPSTTLDNHPLSSTPPAQTREHTWAYCRPRTQPGAI